MYGLITACLFLLLPFMYFFYEEKSDEVTWKSVSQMSPLLKSCICINTSCFTNEGNICYHTPQYYTHKQNNFLYTFNS